MKLRLKNKINIKIIVNRIIIDFFNNKDSYLKWWSQPYIFGYEW